MKKQESIKKPYNPPQFQVFGSIEQLTKLGGVGLTNPSGDYGLDGEYGNGDYYS